MNIINPTQQVPYVEVDPTLRIKPVVLDIGDWNMDTTQNVNVAHGLGSEFDKIRSVDAWVRNDLGTNLEPLSVFTDAADPNLLGGGVLLINSTNVQLFRRTGGNFDNANFDATSYNRGWIIIWMED